MFEALFAMKYHAEWAGKWWKFCESREIADLCLQKNCTDIHVCKEKKDEERYLGDNISKDGRNVENIEAIVNEGKGILHKIIS